MATPFVQGQLLSRKVSIIIDTACAHSRRPMRLEVDSDLDVDVVEGSAETVLTAPLLNLAKLKDPSIIDAF
jgi:hypothetical protein